MSAIAPPLFAASSPQWSLSTREKGFPFESAAAPSDPLTVFISGSIPPLTLFPGDGCQLAAANAASLDFFADAARLVRKWAARSSSSEDASEEDDESESVSESESESESLEESESESE